VSRLRMCLALTAGILWAWPHAVAQQSMASLESRAANTVAHNVEEIRSQNKLPQLARMEDPQLRDSACKRAEDGTKSWRKGSLVVVRNGAVTLANFSYSTPDLNQKDPQFELWVRDEMRDARRFAVGVCLVPNSQEPGGRYWIEVASYMGATKSFFYRTGLGVAHLWSK
jgi:hypothetical protein